MSGTCFYLFISQWGSEIVYSERKCGSVFCNYHHTISVAFIMCFDGKKSLFDFLSWKFRDHTLFSCGIFPYTQCIHEWWSVSTPILWHNLVASLCGYLPPSIQSSSHAVVGLLSFALFWHVIHDFRCISLGITPCRPDPWSCILCLFLFLYVLLRHAIWWFRWPF